MAGEAKVTVFVAYIKQFLTGVAGIVDCVAGAAFHLAAPKHIGDRDDA